MIPNAAQPNQMANVQNDSTTNDRIKKGHVVGDSYVYVKDQIGNWNKDWDNVKNMHAINDVPEPVRRYPNEPYNNNPYNSNPYGGNNYGSSNLYGGSYGYGGAYGYGAPGGGFIERGCGNIFFLFKIFKIIYSCYNIASFPCMNNGECMQTGLYSYSCTCAFSFYGRVCEYRNVGQIVGLVLGIVLPLIFIAIALILIYVFCIRNRNLKR